MLSILLLSWPFLRAPRCCVSAIGASVHLHMHCRGQGYGCSTEVVFCTSCMCVTVKTTLLFVFTITAQEESVDTALRWSFVPIVCVSQLKPHFFLFSPSLLRRRVWTQLWGGFPYQRMTVMEKVRTRALCLYVYMVCCMHRRVFPFNVRLMPKVVVFKIRSEWCLIPFLVPQLPACIAAEPRKLWFLVNLSWLNVQCVRWKRG
jgi:hypothetical protein